MAYKHVGRIKKTKRKVIVAYRTVPGEPENCIVVTTENLMSDEHDSLMTLVESDAGQNASEFAEAMARSILPDGRNMLAGFHVTGKMIKVATSEVEMLPDRSTSISLDELNRLIAQQKGVSVADLAITDPLGSKSVAEPSQTPIAGADEILPTPPQTPIAGADEIGIFEETTVLTNEQLAEKYRNDATALTREAKRLREEADKLSPRKKAPVKKKTTAKASTRKTTPKKAQPKKVSGDTASDAQSKDDH